MPQADFVRTPNVLPQAIDPKQTPEVVGMLVSHLNASKCPDSILFRSSSAYAIDRALAAITALSYFGPLLQKGNAELRKPIEDGWHGIWCWMTFFYAQSSNPLLGSPAKRRHLLEMVAHTLYCLSLDDALQALMPAAPGMAALLTKVWLHEDPYEDAMPVGSTALYNVLFVATDSMVDEIIQTARSTVSSIAELGLSRLGTLLDKPQLDPNQLLAKGGIRLVTKALLRLSATGLQDEEVYAAGSCFAFISNLVELGDGVPHVRQAIKDGLLQAFVNISPAFSPLKTNAHGDAMRLIEHTIPRYLVYRSIIIAVDTALQKTEAPEDLAKVQGSPIAASWHQMQKLVLERLRIKYVSDVNRGTVFCDICRKQALKKAFKRCTGCGVVVYCSKECQTTGWKKGHKEECSLRKKITADRDFQHYLATYDVTRNVQHLHDIAARDFPGVPTAHLGMCVDYSVFPTAYSVFLLDKHDVLGRIEPSRVGEACCERALEQARTRGGEMTLIESKICVGQTLTVVMTLTAYSIWECMPQVEGRE
ncbi:hypothetical protein EWM64_g9477 [Hericium alpestre]|uniref:MYND-type domain-containing protein n=1 Tax=Hericium alpestre TaxID=135208 RepID=A0A4Y9ZIF2_9AGAM|nr:hypothetical protein EWM64_g9477 [Hericium alpestre]